jgi:hypothetical protein
MSETDDQRCGGSRHAHASESALLRRTRGGAVLVWAWWLLLAVAVAGGLALAPYALRGQDLGAASLSLRAGVIVAGLGVVLLVLCARIAGLRALAGLAGLAFGVALLLVGVRPAIAAGASPYATTLVAALVMTFVTLGLTYGRRAVAIAGAVSMAVTLTATTALAAWLVAIVAAGDSLWIAVAVLATFGALCDVTITQVSTVVVGARSAGRERLDAEALRDVRRDSLHVGGDHLVSMIHTIGFAVLAGPVLASTGNVDLGPDVTVALIGAIAMAIATLAVTRLASWAIGGLAGSALAQLEVDEH